jgi:hypothetical protein
MALVSPLHHLFTPETWPASSQTLRWHARPRPCPRGQSLNVGPWGTDHAQPGLPRDRGQEPGCKRTVQDLTGPLWDGSKGSGLPWLLATLLLGRACAARRMARAVGGHVRPGSRWGGGLRNAARSSESGRQVDGTVDAAAL